MKTKLKNYGELAAALLVGVIAVGVMFGQIVPDLRIVEVGVLILIVGLILKD